MFDQYCAVRFYRGTGLGNRLFPWARAVLFSHQYNIPILMPQWFHFRKAPFIKGGINYKDSIKKILLYNNFYNSGEYISGINKFKILHSHRSNINVIRNPIHTSAGKCRYVFEGDGNHFLDLSDFRELIKNKLWSMVHPKLKDYLKNFSVPPIVMNIRRGKDFREAIDPSDFFSKGALRTPLHWFKNSLHLIRKFMDEEIPALIITDGNQQDMKDLLKMPNVALANSPAAITDLLLLSRAKIILGSGGSSFSAWGSFLSGAATITIPGQSLQWFKINNNLAQQYVGTFDPLKSDKKILQAIYEKL